MSMLRTFSIIVGLTFPIIHAAFAQAPEAPSQDEIKEAFELFNTHPDANLHMAAREWLVALGAPALEGFVAALDESVQDIDTNHDSEAIAAIGAIKAKPEIAVPVLVKQLKNFARKGEAAEALAAYGAAAIDALPALLEETDSQEFKQRSSDVRMSVLRAICAIGPAEFSVLPEEMRLGVVESFNEKPAGQRVSGYTFENLPVLDLKTAKAKLEEEKANVAGFKEESTPCHGTLSPEGTEWAVVRTQVPGVIEGVRTYNYALRLNDGSKPIELLTASEEFTSGWSAYFECDLVETDSFKVKWLCPLQLIAVDWKYAQGPGTGYYTDAQSLVVLKADGGWKRVYENRYNCFGRGGPNDYGYEDEELAWDSEKGVLKIRHETRTEYAAEESLPLSRVTVDGDYTQHEQNVTVATERIYRLNGDTLEYIGGKRLLNPGGGKFKLSDIPLYIDRYKDDPAKAIARIRKLNPRFSTGEEFEGAVVLETGIPAEGK